MGHVRGFTSIILAHGPDAYKEGIAHDLLISCRPNIIVGALNQRKRCFLGEDAWLATPWTHISKTEYERLIDCMALLPNLFDDWYQADALPLPEQRVPQWKALIRQTWDLHARLVSWYDRFSSRIGDLTVIPTTIDSGFSDACGRGSFPGSFRFQTMRSVNLYMIYCGIHLIVYNLLNHAYNTIKGIDAKCISIAPCNPAALRCYACLAKARLSNEPGYYSCDCGWIEKQPKNDVSDLPPLLPHHSPDIMAPILDRHPYHVFSCAMSEHECSQRFF